MSKHPKNDKPHGDLKSKAVAAGAIMLAAGLITSNAFAADAPKVMIQRAGLTPTMGRTVPTVVPLNFFDVLKLFDSDGAIAFDLVKKLLELSYDEEALFAPYVNRGGIILVNNVIAVADTLEDRPLKIGTIADAINQSPALKNASVLLTDFMSQNKGNLLAPEKIAEISAKTGVPPETLAAQMKFQKLWQQDAIGDWWESGTPLSTGQESSLGTYASPKGAATLPAAAGAAAPAGAKP